MNSTKHTRLSVFKLMNCKYEQIHIKKGTTQRGTLLFELIDLASDISTGKAG